MRHSSIASSFTSNVDAAYAATRADVLQEGERECGHCGSGALFIYSCAHPGCMVALCSTCRILCLDCMAPYCEDHAKGDAGCAGSCISCSNFRAALLLEGDDDEVADTDGGGFCEASTPVSLEVEA